MMYFTVFYNPLAIKRRRDTKEEKLMNPTIKIVQIELVQIDFIKIRKEKLTFSHSFVILNATIHRSG